MMRSFVIVSAVVCAFAVAACGGAPSASDVDSSAEAVGAAASLSAFGKTLVGKYADAQAPGAKAELASLELHTDGTYAAVKTVGKKSETGRFSAKSTATKKSLTLTPKSGAARTYTVELAEDYSTLQLTSGRNVQLFFATGVMSCTSDADCGANAVCNFGNEGHECVSTTVPSKPDAGPSDGVACSARRGGALITWEISGIDGVHPQAKAGETGHTEQFSVWTTNSEFIDEAKRVKETTPEGGSWRTPNFDKVIDGKDDCNAQYTWHVDPASMGWAEITMELCDGTPGYVEANKATWIKTVGRYCPWGPRLVSIDDRR